jgi:hypothetical protein
MRLLAPYTVALLFLFGAGACTKKQATAPAGPAGEKGSDAVITNSVFTVPSASWHKRGDSATWEASVPVPVITHDLATNGLAKMYLLRGSSWWPLPYIESREALTQFSLETGKIILLRSEAHGEAEQPGTHTFRLAVAATEPQ